MKTFIDKHFRNEMLSQNAYNACNLSCEINPCSSSWQWVEEDCETKFLNQHLKSYFLQTHKLYKFTNNLSIIKIILNHQFIF